VAGVDLNLFADARDGVIDGPRRRRIEVSPHLAEQFVPGHEPILSLGEEPQDFELPVGEMKSAVVVRRLLSDEIDRPHCQNQAFHRRSGSAQDGTRPRQQFLEIEGLGDIVVGPQIEAAQFVRLLRARSASRWGDARSGRRTPHNSKPSVSGSITSRMTRLGREAFTLIQCGGATVDARHIEALVRQIVDEDASERRVVFNDQNPFLHRSLPSES